MIPVFTARRRAEEFASLVEATSTGDVRDARLAEFLEIVDALRDVPAPEPRPEFVADLRSRLLTAADTLLAPDAEARLTLPARRSTRDRRIAAAIGGFALVGATTSMAMAAQSALPGDLLYPLKRAIENAEAGFTVDEGQRGATLLASATGRLDEVAALTEAGRSEDSATIADTLDTFTEQATEASGLILEDYSKTGQESTIAELRDFTAASMAALAELEGVVPAEARDELLRAARVLTQIDAAAERLCPSCGGDGITEIPAILTSAAIAGNFGTTVTPGTREGAGDREARTDGTTLPTTDGSLEPGSVLESPSPDSDPPPEDTDGDDTPEDPIGDLADSLAGAGDSQPTSNPTGLPGVSELSDSAESGTSSLTGN